MEFDSDMICFWSDCILFNKLLYSNPEARLHCSAIISWVSNSNAEPKLIDKKWTKSLSDFLAEPSAMFEGMETAAL